MEGIPTGIDFFDAGADGFYRTKPYLVFGGSGTGKSIFGLQYAAAGLALGESALYVCREKADDLILQGERLGFPLSQYVDNNQLVLLEYDEGFREIVTRSGPEAVLAELQSEVADLGVRRVVLDPVDPFFSSMDDESILRSELRMLTSRFEEMGWTPLLLCDSGTMQQAFVLRVFSEVCWGLFELQRGNEGDSGPEHELLVYKMRNVQLPRSKFGFRIGEHGISSGAEAPGATGKRSFARFRRSESPGAGDRAATPDAAPAPPAEEVVEAPVVAAAAVVEVPVVAAPSDAATPAVAAPVPEGAAATSSGDDDLELLDETALDELETLMRRRSPILRPAPATAKPRPVAAVAAVPVEIPAPAPAPLFEARVLVVESDADARRLLASACGPDLRVLEAEDGVGGLRMAAAEHPDLIVMGARMPRLNGIGLCRILREHGISTPIILLCSAHAGPGEAPRSLAAGADLALPKPPEERDLRPAIARLLKAKPPGSITWPVLDSATAARRLVPRTLEAAEFEAEVARARSWAEAAGVPISLIGYEFRFVEGKGGAFIERFFDVLAKRVRAEDALCRLEGRRLAVILVDADDTGARAVIQRVHHEMAEQASLFLGDQSVKPKALYRVLTLQPDALADDQLEPPYIEHLFAVKPRLIEEDQDDRPGEPIEKYPLLEAVYHALSGELALVTSPLDGRVYEIGQERGSRAVTVEGHRYRLQHAREESPAGFRARSGAQIVWVETPDAETRVVARIEDGRVFRGREA